MASINSVNRRTINLPKTITLPRPLNIPFGKTAEQQSGYMVSVMTPAQRAVYYSLVGVWVVALTVFWTWWLRQEHIVSISGMVINTVLLLWSVMMPGYFFYFAGQMKRPNPAIEVPKGRVAMIVTKAPSEPWEILERTLIAMKNQNYPYEYDVWLADERPSLEVLDWCFENNVHLSTRHNFGVFSVDGYQNEEFPRRAKSKEGNLSYFYETFGYSSYDFVAQLDADHVPTENYLLEMMRPFANAKVGYVAAPSICDANVEDSWVVNARLFVEAPLHGALQAGYNGKWAPMAIGSHYAVRVEAVKSLRHTRRTSFWSKEYVTIEGGLGAELAEDHVTTMSMISAGWEGAFAFDAIAHGDGAPDFASSITQEMQWSRSLMTVLLRWTESYFRFGKMSRALKAQFGFAQFWYPLFAFTMLLGFQMSNIALLRQEAWVNIHYPTFLLFFMPLSLSALLPIWWVHRLGHLRPYDSKLVSWEMILFTYVRWPWALWGVIQAIIGVVFLNKELQFKVTPKGVTSAKPLPIEVLVPYILMVLVSTFVVLLVDKPGSAAGYYFLSLKCAIEYLLVLIAIVYLHYRENRQKLTISPFIFFGKHIAIISALITIVGFAIVLRGPTAVWAILFGAL